MKPLVIITDMAPQGDDAVAVAMLVAHPIDIRLIVTTPGNVWAEQAAHAARSLLQRLGKSIDVCVGASAAAMEVRRRAFLHGTGAPARYAGALGIEPPQETAPTCDDLLGLLAAAPKPDLLVIGPATPLMPILKTHRDVAAKIGRVFLMGGVIDGSGNATPAAEFNFWFDAESAETLLASDVPLTLLPLDVTRGLHYSDEFAARLDVNHPIAAYVNDCIRSPAPAPVCDELLAAVLLKPGLVTKREMLRLAVDTKPGARYGAVMKLDGSASRRAVDVIARVDRAAFWTLMQESFTQHPDLNGWHRDV